MYINNRLQQSKIKKPKKLKKRMFLRFLHRQLKEVKPNLHLRLWQEISLSNNKKSLQSSMYHKGSQNLQYKFLMQVQNYTNKLQEQHLFPLRRLLLKIKFHHRQEQLLFKIFLQKNQKDNKLRLEIKNKLKYRMLFN